MIVGPPAVGKMTVGQELAKLTGFKLFHNHQTIDLVLPYFDFGTPPFTRLVGLFRRRLLEEVAASDLKGLIFSYVWAFDMPSDTRAFRRWAGIFKRHGARVFLVELSASLRERLRRNATPNRLHHKPSKRDVTASRKNLLRLDR
ncbi:MAG: AAA family ATPase, partial [bacterium]